jgi:hypothetical protein
VARAAGARCWAARPAVTDCDNNGVRYIASAIRSFADAETEKVFGRERSRRLPPDVQQGRTGSSCSCTRRSA